MNYKKPTFWIVALSLFACIAVGVCFLTKQKEPTIYDIFSQDGYVVQNQTPATLTLSLAKSALPDKIYTSDGYEFEKEQVVVYQTSNTTIYLHKAMLSNESDDLLYFMFDFSFDFENYGSIYSPFSFVPDEEDGMQHSIYLENRDLRDSKTTYPDALSIRGFGPGTQFALYVSKDACLASEDELFIDIQCYTISYATVGFKIYHP